MSACSAVLSVGEPIHVRGAAARAVEPYEAAKMNVVLEGDNSGRYRARVRYLLEGDELPQEVAADVVMRVK